MIDAIRILGRRYTLKLVPKSALEPRLVGAVDHASGEIEICESLAPDMRRETVLHEVLHAIEHIMGLENDERHVIAVSAALWAIAQANPEAMRWMLGLEPDDADSPAA